MKKMKKMIGVLLALVMVFSLSTAAFAGGIRPMASSPEVTGSITIKGAVSGETYTIYKMFDLSYSNEDADNNATGSSSYTYTVADQWTAFFAAGAPGAGYITVNDSGYVTDFTMTGSDAADFAKAALAWAEGNGITGTEISFTYDPETGSSSTSGCSVGYDSIKDVDGVVTADITIGSLDLGYYLIDTTLGSLCMLDSTNANAEIDEKNPTPTVTKYVRDVTDKDAERDYDKDDNADVVDTLEYEIIIESAANSHNLCLHDVIEDDMILDGGSVKVYLNGNAGTGTLVNSGNYTLTVFGADNVNEEDDCCFEIVFNDEFLETLGETDRLYVIYTVTLDEEEEWDGDVHDFKNVAHLSYGSVTTSPPAETDTYSYGFEIYKYTWGGNSEVSLGGAKFVVKYVDSGTTYYAVFDREEELDYYVLAGWTVDSTDATVLETPSDGLLYVEGFDPDTTYLIEETEAPDGYNILSSDVSVRINVDETDHSRFTVTYTYNGNSSTVSDHIVQIENNQGSILPGTGGMGTTVFYVIGIIVLAGALVLIVTRRRVNRAE